MVQEKAGTFRNVCIWSADPTLQIARFEIFGLMQVLQLWNPTDGPQTRHPLFPAISIFVLACQTFGVVWKGVDRSGSRQPLLMRLSARMAALRVGGVPLAPGTGCSCKQEW